MNQPHFNDLMNPFGQALYQVWLSYLNGKDPTQWTEKARKAANTLNKYLPEDAKIKVG